MLGAAQQVGARRFIHTGTEAALVRGQHLRGVDETAPLAFDSSYPYCRTKALAEQAVRDENCAGFETIVLRPRFIWGPGDQTILPLLQKMAANCGREGPPGSSRRAGGSSPVLRPPEYRRNTLS
jgi:nucleoside-diphosphate-sugar epimerase